MHDVLIWDTKGRALGDGSPIRKRALMHDALSIIYAGRIRSGAWVDALIAAAMGASCLMVSGAITKN